MDRGPAAKITYPRALLKLSGESLSGTRGVPLDPTALRYTANQIKEAVGAGTEMAVVIGGGNIWRGRDAQAEGMDRATADYAGMLATIINSLVMQDALEKEGVKTRTQTALAIQSIAEPYIRRRAIRHLEKGRVVIFAAGTGNPYMTTDTAAALRAVEIGADVILMAKRGVDGVYDSDPNIYPNAKKFKTITHIEAINKRLEIMDSTALSLCMENNIPIVVFDFNASNSIIRILKGVSLGTLIASE